MRRKLVKLGQSALVVTVPYKWIDAQGLAQGDEVEIIEQQNDLILSSPKSSQTKKKTINVKKFNKNHVRSVIASAYKAGYDEITLVFEEEVNPHHVYTIANAFTGLEIFSTSKNTFVIKSFMKKQEETEKLIIRLFQTTKYVAGLLYDEWTATDEKELTTLVKQTNMKLRDHCLRSIQLSKFGDEKSYDYYDLVTILEKITTELYYFADNIRGCRVEKRYIKDLCRFIDAFYYAYLKKDVMLSNKLWKEIRDYSKKTFEKSSNKKENRFVLMHSYHTVKLLRHLSSRLLSLSS